MSDLNLWKMFLDYGAMGVGFGMAILSLFLQTRQNNRILDMAERDAMTRAELTSAVNSLREVVQDKLHG